MDQSSIYQVPGIQQPPINGRAVHAAYEARFRLAVLAAMFRALSVLFSTVQRRDDPINIVVGAGDSTGYRIERITIGVSLLSAVTVIWHGSPNR